MIKNIGYFKDYTDSTIKGVYQVNNSKIIEVSMLFNRVDRDVLCVPTHHYCNLGCKMCHLTNSKISKPMQRVKADDLIECICDMLKKYRRDKKNLLISYMGVGDALMNLDLLENVYKQEFEIKKLGYENIGYAIATMMPNNNMLALKKLVNELKMPLKVHFSMHSPVDRIRNKLIPSSKVKVEDALNMLLIYGYMVRKDKVILDKYRLIHSDDVAVEIHYTLIEGTNDSDRELTKLIKLLKEYKIPIKFIKFNPIDNLKKSKKELLWVNQIKNAIPELKVRIYAPPGREIGSSCGEFTKYYYLEDVLDKREVSKFNRWHKEHLINN